MEFEQLKYLSFFGPTAAAQHDDDDLESTRLIHHNMSKKSQSPSSCAECDGCNAPHARLQ
jgi:hypothetical protein